MNKALIISNTRLKHSTIVESKYDFTYADTSKLGDLILKAKDVNLVVLSLKVEELDSLKPTLLALNICKLVHIVLAVQAPTSHQVFSEFKKSFKLYSQKTSFKEIHFIAEQADWYSNTSLDDLLQKINTKAPYNPTDFRFSVASVQGKTLKGKTLSGAIADNQEVLILPSQQKTKVLSSDDGLLLSSTEKIQSGNIICRPNNLPNSASELDIKLFWLSPQSWRAGNQRILVKHNSFRVNGFIENISYSIDSMDLHRQEVTQLDCGSFSKVKLTCAENLYFDAYHNNRNNGFLELLDPESQELLGYGFIKSESRETQKDQVKSTNIKVEDFDLTREDYEKRNGHKGCVLWFTGLSGSGKSTIAKALMAELHAQGKHVNSLDGDNVRFGLCSDLGFTAKDRSENIRRIGELAKLFMENGNIVLCSFISPFQKDRDFVRSILPDGRFFEVFVDTNIETCIERDPKGLYKKALAGEINGFTGIDSPYEAPQTPEIHLKTDQLNPEEFLQELITQLQAIL
ncbi:sulfate adenylyltransferase, large subunit subfamily, putative [Lentisphaera araneosa HTCC2155]|uniref:Adenylyl-sulfate kinase n=1 Tax=Lentisphaera araneosa HTCC2155 TaxID=313628 RepID=A6DQG2_9BACT|nr:adenylyl-sulfate kinase [Lentisphaera araneosa]EDM26043.1 sulfate adenylyltransferase, large subunit subfamily, putative [Lentisphaera araneosa HTCC2155]